MRIHLVTLRYSPQVAGFDDAPLRAVLGADEIVSLREHFFVVQDLPHLLCVVTCASPSSREEGGRSANHGPRESSPAGASIAQVVRASATAQPAPRDGLDAEGQALYDKVRRWRAQTARQEGVPPYVLLTNRQLGEIVQARPASKAALGRLDGVGDKKVARYGDALLALLAPAVGEPAETTA